MELDLVAIVGALFTVGTSAAVVIGILRGARPKRRWTWIRPPLLRIADGVPLEVGACAIRALRQVEALGGRSRGYDRGGPSVAGWGEICIVVLEKWAEEDHAGRTHTNVNADRKAANYALIELPRSGTTDLVALHELLHAYGFGHVSVGGHVMSATTTRLGDSVEGIAEVFARPV